MIRAVEVIETTVVDGRAIRQLHEGIKLGLEVFRQLVMRVVGFVYTLANLRKARTLIA